MTTGRGCIALIGQGCSPSVPEAKKWFKIAAELHGTREALIFLGEMASGGTTSLMKMFVRSRTEDAAEAKNLFRAAVEADDSPSESYCIFAPAGHARDLARIGLATMLMKKGGDDALVEAASLLDAVLDHDNIPSNQAMQLRRPNSEARALRADIILRQQAPGALAEALELVEAIPAADLEGIEDLAAHPIDSHHARDGPAHRRRHEPQRDARGGLAVDGGNPSPSSYGPGNRGGGSERECRRFHAPYLIPRRPLPRWAWIRRRRRARTARPRSATSPEQ